MDVQNAFPSRISLRTGHRACLNFVVAISLLLIGGISWSQTTKAEKSNPALPDSQPELTQLKTDVERQVIETQNRLNAWRNVVASLTIVRNNISAAAPPNPAAISKLSLKGQSPAEERDAIQVVLLQFQSLYFSGQVPFGVGFGTANAAPTDPDATVFMSDFQNKLLGFQNDAGLGSYIQLTFGENLKREDLTPQFLQEMQQKLSLEAFTRQKADVGKLVDNALQQASAQRDGIAKALADLQAKDDAIAAKLGVAKVEINQLAIQLGLPLFCGTVLLMLTIPMVLQSISKSTASAEQAQAIFASGILVEIITVLLLTMSILILGLSGKIEGPVLGTLLGGISGYVLNRFRGRNSGTDQDSSSNGEQASPTSARSTASVPDKSSSSQISSQKAGA